MTHRRFDVEVVCSRATRSRFVIAGLLAALALLTGGAATSAAATLGVTTGGADTGDCQDSPCLTIQYAVNQAQQGDTIDVGAGTFGSTTGPATVSVDKPNLKISGVDTADTVIEAPEGPTGATAFEIGEAGDDLTIQNLSITSPEDGFANDLRGIRTAAGPVVVDDLRITGVQISGLRYGFETPSVATAQQATITNMTMRNSYLHGNEYAMWFGGDTNGLSVTESVISGNDFGIQSYPPEPNPSFEPGVFDEILISDSTFTANAKKAIYLEAANDLMIEGVNVLETGSVEPVNPPAFKPPFDGIDINAKYGDFENITITGSVSSGTVTNPARSLAVQGGVSIKSRNDGPTYSAHPASITDIDVVDLAADENENGLILGGDLDRISVSGSQFADNDYAGIALVRETAGYPSSITNLDVTTSDFEGNVFGIGSNTGTDQTDLSNMAVTNSSFNDNAAAGIGIEAATVTGGLVPFIKGNMFTGNLDGIDNGSGVEFDAENNWWGCNAGPGASGCDTTVGQADSSPHLQLSVSTGQNAVGPGGTTPVTATFERNSAGQSVAAPVFDGSTINFSATGGSVNPASAVVSDGAAATTFTAGSTPGPAGVTAAFGGVGVNAVIAVNGSQPTVSAPSLAGSGVVGEELTCTPGEVTGGIPTPTVETVLLRDGVAIPGRRGLSYTPVPPDVGKSITCRTTVTNPVGLSLIHI